MKSVPTPDWAVEAKCAMIRRNDMTVTELAREIGVSRPQVSAVINGTIVSPVIKAKIQNYLGLTDKASSPVN